MRNVCQSEWNVHWTLEERLHEVSADAGALCLAPGCVYGRVWVSHDEVDERGDLLGRATLVCTDWSRATPLRPLAWDWCPCRGRRVLINKRNPPPRYVIRYADCSRGDGLRLWRIWRSENRSCSLPDLGPCRSRGVHCDDPLSRSRRLPDGPTLALCVSGGRRRPRCCVSPWACCGSAS